MSSTTVVEAPLGLKGLGKTPLAAGRLGDRYVTKEEGSETSRVYVLSASGRTSAGSQIANVTTYVKEHLNEDNAGGLMKDLAYSLTERPVPLEWRAALPASSHRDLLRSLESGSILPTKGVEQPRLGFVFSGVGAQTHAMGRELMRDYPVFSAAMHRADKYLTFLGAKWSLLDELFKDTGSSIIDRVDVAIPATASIQMALVLLLQSWNIKPVAVNANSTGEVAAAFTTGAFSLEASITIAYQRGAAAGKLAEKRPDLRGAVLAIGSDRATIEPMLKDLKSGRLDVGAILGPNLVSVAGDEAAITELQGTLKGLKIFAKRTPMQLAYHSFHMSPIAPDFLTSLGDIRPRKSDGPQFYSSLTGSRVDTATALKSSYWVDNMLGQVNLLDAGRSLCTEMNVDALVEIGPHPTFKRPIEDMLKQNSEWGSKIRYMPSLERGKDSTTAMQQLACEVFTMGYPVDISAVNALQGMTSGEMLIDLSPYVSCRYSRA